MLALSHRDMSSPPSTASAPAARPGIARTVGRAASFVVLLTGALAALVMIVVPLMTGSQTYTVLTSSMAPKYAPGTFLVVQPTPFSELQLGDVITYQIESGQPAVISHRITGVEATQAGARVLITKGDNNSLADASTVQEAQVRGRLLYAVPYVGHVAHAIGQHRDVVAPILAAGFIGFGVLSFAKGAMVKVRSRPADRSEP